MQLVYHAKEYGIRSAAQTYMVSHNTIRLWLRRYSKSLKAKLYNRQSKSKRHPLVETETLSSIR